MASTRSTAARAGAPGRRRNHRVLRVPARRRQWVCPADMLLRAIGEPIARNIHTGLLEHHDITLNTPALARLAAFTGRSAASLAKTLPSLDTA